MKLNYTTGYAGTGKSTKLTKLVSTLNPTTTVIIAPTHKALHRLVNELPPEYEVKTIHSLLGWIPAINEEAKRVEHIDTTIKLEKDLNEYDTIVIDEAGMMSEDMLLEITGKLEEANDYDTDNIVLHLFLDPYQLLPVKGTQIQTDPETTKNLTTQHRSESPDVVTLYTKFVNYLEGTNKDDLSTPYSKNVKEFDISKFKKGDRLLAYTNKAVGDWNQTIAKQLGVKGYEGQEVQLGNILDLVECKQFVYPTLSDLMKWYHSGKLKLQNTRINKRFLEASLNQLLVNKHIEFISDGNLVYPIIVGIGKANVVLKEAKSRAVEDKKHFKDVYALGRAYIMDYSYATTVHKAQGSEFKRVFIDKRDIQKSIFNNSYTNYARLMYVAISRSKKKIYI